jgi:ParB family transcriptional regulator, chromosome partitioning protein
MTDQKQDHDTTSSQDGPRDLPASGPQVVFLDPSQLTVDPGNPRAAVGDIADLVASIKSVGVLQPLTVTRDGDSHHVVFGHRRRAAAIAAGVQVPCLVQKDSGAADRLTRQIIENIQRADLTTDEEVAAYQQLAAFDMSPTKIARAVGVKPNRVKTALGVAEKLSEDVRAKASASGLDLEQQAELGDFQDDPDVIQALTQAGETGPGVFRHELERARADRSRRQQIERVKTELAAAGTVLLEQSPGYGANDTKICAVEQLYDGDGKALTVKTHGDCPGRAAFVTSWGDTRHYCLDPKAHGHRTKRGSSPLAEDERQQRRKVIEGNRDWRAATKVRHEFITDRARARKAPPGLSRFLTRSLVSPTSDLRKLMDYYQKDILAAALRFLGRDVAADNPDTLRTALSDLVAAAPEARVLNLQFAILAAAHEHAMDTYTWRSHYAESAAWLLYLETLGYTLSEIEKRAIPRSARRPKAGTGKRRGAKATDATAGGDQETTGEAATEPDATRQDRRRQAEGEATGTA